MGSRKLGVEQVEAGSQGPTARLATALMQGILNQQDALVPSSPSFRRTALDLAPTSEPSTQQVASDSPGYSRDAENVIIIDSPGRGG